MWTSAAKAIAKFSEGVVTALDAHGYPISVRQTKLAYDASSGELPIVLPDALEPVASAANLLCHVHDDNLWGIKMISVRGQIERRERGWVFVTTRYEPQSDLAMIGKIRRSTHAYLSKRGLPVPKVDFDAIAKLWEEAKRVPRS